MGWNSVSWTSPFLTTAFLYCFSAFDDLRRVLYTWSIGSSRSTDFYGLQDGIKYVDKESYKHKDLGFRRTAFFNYFAIFETVGRFATLIFVFLQALSQIAPFMPNYNRPVQRLSVSGSLICMFGWIANIGRFMEAGFKI